VTEETGHLAGGAPRRCRRPGHPVVSRRALIVLAVIAGALVGGTNAAVAAEHTKAGDQLQAAWVELAAGRTAIVRAVTEARNCPPVNVDGAKRSMRVRADPTSDFGVLTCERQLEPNVRKVVLAGKKLPTPASSPRRIAVVGDAGCRIDPPGRAQACNDPDRWPFAQVAKSVAEWHPELIVHVGDYLYREQACPEGNDGCAGSPFGDKWPTWDADLFSPAASALKAAPWIFVRGNHEACSRSGEGWFRFLDTRDVPRPCQDFTLPYAVNIGNEMRMVVMDSSGASDFAPFNPEQYAPQFSALPELAGDRAWLLTHRPLWGLAAIKGGTDFALTNTTLETASGNSLPDAIRMVLSGHLHATEVFGFTGNRSPQVVVGNSGTLLDDQITKPIVGTDAGGETITDALAASRFGFATFTSEGPGWQLSLRGVGGNAFARCRVAAGSAACETGRR
jgi:hypothetical protein